MSKTLLTDEIIKREADIMMGRNLVENPLANYPDLDPCICGSGHIWRRCHKSSLIQLVPRDEAEKIERFLERKAQLARK